MKMMKTKSHKKMSMMGGGLTKWVRHPGMSASKGFKVGNPKGVKHGNRVPKVKAKKREASGAPKKFRHSYTSNTPV